jgi:hypothetical protein
MIGPKACDGKGTPRLSWTAPPLHVPCPQLPLTAERSATLSWAAPPVQGLGCPAPFTGRGAECDSEGVLPAAATARQRKRGDRSTVAKLGLRSAHKASGKMASKTSRFLIRLLPLPKPVALLASGSTPLGGERCKYGSTPDLKTARPCTRVGRAGGRGGSVRIPLPA